MKKVVRNVRWTEFPLRGNQHPARNLKESDNHPWKPFSYPALSQVDFPILSLNVLITENNI